MKAWILDYLTFLIIKWVDSTTFNPYLLGSKKWKKAFDPKLCILYQKEVEDSKQGRLRKIDPESFKVFTEVCKTFVKSGDTPYHELQKTIKKKTSDNLHKEDFCWYSQPFRKDMQTNSDQKQVMHQMATAALKQNHQICAFLLKQYAYPDMKPSSLTNILACFVKWTYRTNLYIVYVKHQKLKHWKMHFLNVQHLLNCIKYVQATLSMLFFPWKWTFTH